MSKKVPRGHGKPFQSKLEPMSQVIRDLRRQRKSYREIAEILRDQYNITADRTTIWSFVKVRSKPRHLIAMRDDSPQISSSATRHGSIRNAIEVLKAKPAPDVKKPVFNFDENKPLTLRKETP